MECDGNTVHVVVPDLADLVVSKLCRLTDKDRDYISVLHAERPLDLKAVEDRLADVSAPSEIKEQAVSFLRALATK